MEDLSSIRWESREGCSLTRCGSYQPIGNDNCLLRSIQVLIVDSDHFDLCPRYGWQRYARSDMVRLWGCKLLSFRPAAISFFADPVVISFAEYVDVQAGYHDAGQWPYGLPWFQVPVRVKGAILGPIVLMNQFRSERLKDNYPCTPEESAVAKGLCPPKCQGWVHSFRRITNLLHAKTIVCWEHGLTDLILNPCVWTEFFIQAKAVWLHWENVFCVVMDLPFLFSLVDLSTTTCRGRMSRQIGADGYRPKHLAQWTFFLQNRSRVLRTLCSSSRRTSFHNFLTMLFPQDSSGQRTLGVKKNPETVLLTSFIWGVNNFSIWSCVGDTAVDGPSSWTAMLAVEVSLGWHTEIYWTCIEHALSECISCCTRAWGVSQMRSRVSLGQRLLLPVEGPGAQVPTLVRHGTRSNNKIYRSQESPMQTLMFHSSDVISSCLSNCVNNITCLSMYSYVFYVILLPILVYSIKYFRFLQISSFFHSTPPHCST